MRLPRPRLAAILLVGLAASGAVGVAALGDGIRPVSLKLSDGGAWLHATAIGALVHVNGPSGRADGVVPLTGAAGHDLQVVDRPPAGSGDAGQILVADLATGDLHRVDRERLAVGRSVRAGGPGLRVVAAGADTYAVDPADGTVRRYEPDSLEPVGPLVRLAGLAGAVGADDGTLWVARSGQPSLVPVRGGAAGPAVTVGSRGGRVVPTLVGGEPVAVDLAEGSAVRVLDGRAQPPLQLPVRGDLLVPRVTEGSTLPLLDPVSGRLALVDVVRGRTTADVPLPAPSGPGTGLGTPLLHDGRVYISRNSFGDVLVLDVASGRFGDPVQVTTGGAGFIHAFTQDGLAWLDDVAGTGAVVIDDNGHRRVDKHADGIAGLAAAAPLPLPPPRTPASASPPPAATARPLPPPAAQPSRRTPAGGEPATLTTPPPPMPPAQPPPETARPTQPPPTVPPPVETPVPQPTTTQPQPTPLPPDVATREPATVAGSTGGRRVVGVAAMGH